MALDKMVKTSNSSMQQENDPSNIEPQLTANPSGRALIRESVTDGVLQPPSPDSSADLWESDVQEKLGIQYDQ